ncbi:hypothetical protein [Streptomyces sp. NPDC005760]|uniref:ATP-binding protein n=1 Tax=Streptomyces sp. NPDC005760 TaxID=3156718 RepID=UPI00340FA47B
MGRRPLAVAGERVLMPGPPGEGEAVELFRERAGRLGVTADDDPYVRELCGRLEGIPLTIEPAAGRLGALSPGQLLKRLDDRFRLLTGGGRDALPRHRTLRTAIGWSHELCTPEERLLWSRLSVFAGRFDLEAAEYVCNGGGLHCDDVLDVLSALLAQPVVAGCSTRAYGAEWLEATGDAVRLRRRDRDWYVGLATWCELDWFSPRQNEVAARVEAELPNLRGALEYCLGRHWLERSVELEPGHDHTRLKALWVLGHVAVLQGDTVPAPAALQEIGELNSNVPMGQVELAMARAFLGDLPDAVRGCEEVRRVCEDHGERWARSYALYVLA